MPKKQAWLVAILMLASAFIGAAASNGLPFVSQAQQRTAGVARPGPRRYEYHFYIAPGPKDLTDQTNKLADEDWELTQVVTDERLVTRYIGFYRREKR
jgi:hypothetical protein